MSGTSIDAIDAVLVDFNGSSPYVVDTHTTPFTNAVRDALVELCQPGANEIQRVGEWDHQLGHLFADTVLALLNKNPQLSNKIKAIGSHGQTIRHRPNDQYPFTLQIGDPNIIAEKTGITTVADFRRRDMACGGQGAPLVVAFHEYLFKKPGKNRVILNLGGIANITYLAAEKPVFGFDTGPANTLLDAWVKRHQNKNYDQNGNWAATGNCQLDLLELLLNDAYFTQPPPKSTGREYFHLQWLETYLEKFAPLKPEDVQATLVSLTTHSIMRAIEVFCPKTDEIIVCGGGSKNAHLIQQLSFLAEKQAISVAISSAFGIDPEWIEAMAFAWLARQRLNRLPGNSIHATGARHEAVLGGVYAVRKEFST